MRSMSFGVISLVSIAPECFGVAPRHCNHRGEYRENGNGFHLFMCQGILPKPFSSCNPSQACRFYFASSARIHIFSVEWRANQVWRPSLKRMQTPSVGPASNLWPCSHSTTTPQDIWFVVHQTSVPLGMGHLFPRRTSGGLVCPAGNA
jgi:hypothetical protein